MKISQEIAYLQRNSTSILHMSLHLFEVRGIPLAGEIELALLLLLLLLICT